MQNRALHSTSSYSMSVVNTHHHMNVSTTYRAAGCHLNKSVYATGTETSVAARNQCDSSSRPAVVGRFFLAQTMMLKMQFCNFMFCYLVLHFHVLYFHVLQRHVLQFPAMLLGPTFSCPAFSRPAFSAPPLGRWSGQTRGSGFDFQP